MDEFLRAVTPDHKNMPKKGKEIELFVEVILDIEPFCLYYVPRNRRDMWEGLMDMWKCNKLYLRHDKDNVRTLKIILLACFTVDIAIENIQLQILQKTFAGSNRYIPCTLKDDSMPVLGLHHAVKEKNRVWIFKESRYANVECIGP
jgi:hypothetical protein